jgi:hypothetical protein
MMNQDVTSAATTDLPVQTALGASKKARRSNQKPGFITHQLRGRSKAGGKQIDGRLVLVRALAEWEACDSSNKLVSTAPLPPLPRRHRLGVRNIGESSRGPQRG